MADYKAKTNWLPDDPITEDDLNRWERGIKDANEEGDEHRKNKENPHGVTKNQLGLGNVENVRQAPKTELDAHVAHKQNPHGVTKGQLGLGSVENYGIASKMESETGTSNAKYMTPLRTKEAIDLSLTSENVNVIPRDSKTSTDLPTTYKNGLTIMYVGDGPAAEGFPGTWGILETYKAVNGTAAIQRYTQVTQNKTWFRRTANSRPWEDWFEYETTEGSQAKVNTHENKKNNPHNVTKAQVGLGNIDNVQQATKVEFNNHLNDKSNPHGVSKAQVGLNNIDNVKQATKSEFDNFVGRRDNPHRVTTEQVNFIDTISAEEPGSSYENGMTMFQNASGVSLGYPANQIIIHTIRHGAHRCFQYVYDSSQGSDRVWYRSWRQDGGWKDFSEFESKEGAQAKVNSHANRSDNPHNVTKAQVGLSNVQNYPVANQATAEAGTNDGTYMTPNRTRQAIEKLATTDQVNNFPLNWKSSSDLPGTYPRGVTVFPANAENGGWPTRYGMIMTIYGDNAAAVQYCTQWSGNGDRVWIRNSQNNESVWRSWIELETTAGSQSKVNATQVHKVTLDSGLGILLPAGTSLNTIYDTGFYRVQNAGGIPDDVNENWGYLIVNKQGSRESMQIFIPFSSRIMYVRSSNDSGSWREWVRQATQNEVRAHTDSRSNPHNVTKAQVGLGNVDNVKQAPESRNLAAGNGLSGGGNLAANRTFELGTPGTITNSTTNSVSGTSHTHTLSISKGDIGLGNVQDFSIALKNEAEAGNASNRYMTPLRTKEAIQALATTEQVNKFSDSYRTGSASPTTYPVGISLFSIGADQSWSPLQHGQVLTVKTGNFRVYQELIGTGNGLTSINKYHRWGYDGKWTDFFAGSGEPFEYLRASLINGWTHHSSWPVEYGIDGSGTVWLRGAMHGGVNGGNPPRHQFVLPQGYRPASTSYYVVNAQPNGDTQGTARLQIQTNGIVLLQHLSHPSATQWISVDLSFKAATNGGLR